MTQRKGKNVKRLRAALTAVCLMVALLAALAPSAHAAPRTPHVPHWPPCQSGVWLDYTWSRDTGDQSIVVYSYLRKQTDNSGNYCGQMQPVTLVKNSGGVGSGDEPLVNAIVQLYRDDNTYLGGYTWSGIGYSHIYQDWWFYGPSIAVACGTSVRAYGSWLEKLQAGGEADFGITVNADGDSIGLFTGAWSPC
jgi:hypothetical protein